MEHFNHTHSGSYGCFRLAGTLDSKLIGNSQKDSRKPLILELSSLGKVCVRGQRGKEGDYLVASIEFRDRQGNTLIKLFFNGLKSSNE